MIHLSVFDIGLFTWGFSGYNKALILDNIKAWQVPATLTHGVLISCRIIDWIFDQEEWLAYSLT